MVELARYAFVALLVCVLLAAIVSFVVMGLSKLRRTARLARAAHEKGRRFFPDDPYDMPRRCADFALISSGHSPRANNVTAGRCLGLPVWAFDFRCELGHGTRRITRHYSVVVVEMGGQSGALLMWPDNDAELAPLAARGPAGRVGRWRIRGPAELAAAVASAWTGPENAEPSIEVRGGVLMVSAPAERSAGSYAVETEKIEPIVAALVGDDS